LQPNYNCSLPLVDSKYLNALFTQYHLQSIPKALVNQMRLAHSVYTVGWTALDILQPNNKFISNTKNTKDYLTDAFEAEEVIDFQRTPQKDVNIVYLHLSHTPRYLK